VSRADGEVFIKKSAERKDTKRGSNNQWCHGLIYYGGSSDNSRLQTAHPRAHQMGRRNSGLSTREKGAGQSAFRTLGSLTLGCKLKRQEGENGTAKAINEEENKDWSPPNLKTD